MGGAHGSRAAANRPRASDAQYTTDAPKRTSRRRWTLLFVTVLLNILSWTSTISFGANVYLFVVCFGRAIEGMHLASKILVVASVSKLDCPLKS